jgi:hypothetical protein
MKREKWFEHLQEAVENNKTGTIRRLVRTARNYYGLNERMVRNV